MAVMLISRAFDKAYSSLSWQLIGAKDCDNWINWHLYGIYGTINACFKCICMVLDCSSFNKRNK